MKCAAFILPLALAGCASPPGPRAILPLTSSAPAGAGERARSLAASVGPALPALWAGAGGIAAWRRVSFVRFTYRAELGAAGKDLLLEAGRAPSPVAAGPLRLGFRPGDWSEISVAAAGASWRLSPGLDAPLPDIADYGPRSIRVLFGFPFHLADPVWEFRKGVAAGGTPDPCVLDVAAARPVSPHASYRLRVDLESGLPGPIVYRSLHPLFPGRVLAAVVTEWRTVGGIRVPAEIVHRLDGARAPSGRYPWEAALAWSSACAVEDPGAGPIPLEDVVLREEISDVELEREAP